ncbi:hypothetical protein D3C76_765650 [compost metagenome]
MVNLSGFRCCSWERAAALFNRVGKSASHRANVCHDRIAHWRACCFERVTGHRNQSRARFEILSWVVLVVAENWSADHQNQIVTFQQLRNRCDASWHQSTEARMTGREWAAWSGWRNPDWSFEEFGQLDAVRVRICGVDVRAQDDRRVGRAVESLHQNLEILVVQAY